MAALFLCCVATSIDCSPNTRCLRECGWISNGQMFVRPRTKSNQLWPLNRCLQKGTWRKFASFCGSHCSPRASCRMPAVTQSRIRCAARARYAFPWQSSELLFHSRDMLPLKIPMTAQATVQKTKKKKHLTTWTYISLWTDSWYLYAHLSVNVCAFFLAFVYIFYLPHSFIFEIFLVLALTFVRMCKYVRASVRACVHSFFCLFILC